MCFAKLSKIERFFLFSKTIILNEKLSDNKCNSFLLFWFKLWFYSQNMSLNYVFGYVIFYRLKLKKNVLVKQSKLSYFTLWFYNWHKINID